MTPAKIPCFIRVYPANDLRVGMALTTIARWKMQPEVDIHLIVCESCESTVDFLHVAHRVFYLPDGPSPRDSYHHFAARSVRLIERLATLYGAEVYAATDDDGLIYGQDFVTRGIDILGRHPEVGMLVSLDLVDKAKNPPDPTVEVGYNHAVGAPGFSRVGLITEFPDLPNDQYSIEIHRQMTAKGFRQAVAPSLEFLHLGRGYSISSPAWWTAASKDGDK